MRHKACLTLPKKPLGYPGDFMHQTQINHHLESLSQENISSN